MDKIIKKLVEWKGKNIPAIIPRETNIQDYLGEEESEWFGIKRKIKFIPLWKWLLK